jgi:hypothetical protein
LQLVRVELQLVCQVAIVSAAKLQPQGLCICYTECTWVHFSIAQRSPNTGIYIYLCVCVCDWFRLSPAVSTSRVATGACRSWSHCSGSNGCRKGCCKMQQPLPARAFLGGLGGSAAQPLPLSLLSAPTRLLDPRARWAGLSLPGRSSSGARRRSPATCLASLCEARRGRVARRRPATARPPPLAPLAELVGGRSAGDEAGGRRW